MQLSKKRNCDDACKAYDGTGGISSCALGFKIDIQYGKKFATDRPAEPCYKPRSNSDLVEAHELIKWLKQPLKQQG